MDGQQLTTLVFVTIAFAVAVWLVLAPGPVTRRRCANCEHSNLVHDPIAGRCRGRVGAGIAVGGAAARDDSPARNVRCGCSDFAGK